MKLRSKINLAFFATFIIIACIYGAILLPFEMKRHDSTLEKIKLSLIAIVEQKKEEIANEIFSRQKEALQFSLDDLIEVKDILTVNAYLPDGKLLACTEKIPPPDLSVSERKMIKDQYVFLEETWRDQPVLTYLINIEVIGKGVGYLKIHSSLVDLKRSQRFTWIIFIALLLTILVVIYGLLNTLLLRSVLRPVFVLNNSMQKIQKSLAGEEADFIRPNEAAKIEKTFKRMSADLPETHASRDEIGQLARSFKQMVASLQLAYGAIQKAEAKYRGIFENAIEGIFQISPQGLFISANPSAAKILGYDSPEHLIKSVNNVSSQIFPTEEDSAELAELFRTHGRISGLEKQLRRKDGSLFWAAVSALCVRDENGKTRYYEGSFIDITERKEKIRAEKEREAAEAAAQAKSNFLASMSHEIRTPMNAVIGLTKLALRTELDAKQKDYLKKVSLSANSLLGIINDILDFSKIEAGKLHLENTPFYLPKVLEELTSILYIETAEKGIELLIHFDEKIPWHLVGDPLRLEQVLINLLNNAIKFTDAGEIIIRLELLEKATEHVRIQFSVTDTGIGIPEEKINSLFASFQQADNSTTRKYGGTGLGLAICKQLVQMMQGQISVQSEPGKGSTFLFDTRFGLQKGAEAQKPVPPPDLVGLRVLVVESNPISSQIIEHMLNSLTFKATLVASGEEALERLKDPEQHFDLVIMAWMLKEMDGLQASEIIKKDPDLAHTPTIIMSAYDSDGTVARMADRMGLNAFLTKPLNPSTLFDSIMDVFGYEGLDQYRKETSLFPDENQLKGIRGAQILLAEDNEINRQVAVELLESEGLLVDVAANGQETVEAAAEKDYDVVLMDIQMPVMDGYTATQEIIKMGKEVPIIAMTAHAMVGEKDKCLQIGMCDYVTKPIDTNHLFNTLIKYIQPGERAAPAVFEKPDQQRSKSDDPNLPEFLPGFDIDAGLARVVGNKRLYWNMLLSLANKYGSIDQDVQEMIQSANLAGAAKIAHKVKGMAGNLGAKALEKAASNLEITLLDNLAEDIDDRFTIFADALQQVVRSVRELEKTLSDDQAETSDAPDAPLDMNEVGTLLNRIADLITSDYGEAINQIDHLKQMMGNSQVKDEIIQLEGWVNEFNDSEALACLDRIAEKLNITLGE